MRAHSPELEYEFKGTNSAPGGRSHPPHAECSAITPPHIPDASLTSGADLGGSRAAILPQGGASQRWRAASS